MSEATLQEHFTRFEKKLKLHLQRNLEGVGIHDALINKRSRWAANAYVGALSAGNPRGYCEQIANDILFEGMERYV